MKCRISILLLPFCLLLIITTPCKTWAGYVLEWQSPDSMTAGILEGTFSNGRFDMDGDGTPEIAMISSKYPSAPYYTYSFYSSGTHVQVWAFAPAFTSGWSQFYGFYDIDGDGKKEAIFDDDAMNGGVMVVNWETSLVEWELGYGHVVAIFDIDSDGRDELIINNYWSPANDCEIWGDGAAAGAIMSEQSATTAAKPNLSQNYPNPANPITTIEFQVQRPGWVNLTIYDAAGRRIRTLVDEERQSGKYCVRWDSKDAQGESVASGAYFYQLKVGTLTSSKKMLMVK